MSKTQLLEEAGRVGLVVHHKWTVEEIKAVIQEHRMNDPNAHPSHKMKSVTQLNMPELKLKAAELGISASTRAGSSERFRTSTACGQHGKCG